jgi:hypothetical protein
LLMKKLCILAVCLSTLTTVSYAQNVGISTNSPQAKLDVVSTNSGILIPRLALTGSNDAATVSSPTTSELIYNTATAGSGSTAVTPGFYYWNGSAWVRLKVGTEGEDHDWYEVGGTSAPNSINDNIYTQGNVGIGVTSPSEKLHVAGNIRVSSLASGIVKANSSGVLSVTSLTGSTGDVLRGDGTFGPGSAFGDNLGNHSATTSLNMNENSVFLRNVTGSVYGIGYGAFGGAQLTLTTDDLISFTESDGSELMASFSLNDGTFSFKNKLRAFDATGLYLQDAAGATGLFVQDGGNVGVGMSTPDYTMELAAGGALSLNDGYLRNVKAAYLKDWDDDSGGSDDTYRLLGRDGAWQFYNGGVVVGNYANGTWTDLADGTLIVEGSVGIGETDPADKLVVSGGRVEFTATTDASGTAGSGVLEIANSLRFDGNEIITNTNAPLYLQNDNNGDLLVDATTLVVDASNNRVGIGESAPASTLEVAGDIRITGDNASLVYENSHETNNDWRLVYSDDFESGTDSWVAQTITATGNNGITRQFNGYAGYSYWVRPTNGNDRVLKKYYNMSGLSYDEVKVEFTYYFLDSWDGENAWVAAGSTESYSSGVRPSALWNSRWDHDWGDPVSGTNFSFYGNSGYSDASTTAIAIFRNNFGGTGFWLCAGSSLDGSISDETFAIDNVRVYVR